MDTFQIYAARPFRSLLQWRLGWALERLFLSAWPKFQVAFPERGTGLVAEAAPSAMLIPCNPLSGVLGISQTPWCLIAFLSLQKTIAETQISKFWSLN